MNHGHRPAHDWAARQSGWARGCAGLLRSLRRLTSRSLRFDNRQAIECVCAHSTPREALEAARRATMFPGGLASKHVDHYLSGHGADYVEDLRGVLSSDAGVRAKLAAAIARADRGCVSIEQHEYSSHDFAFAFGAIDRMDYAVDRAAGTVHVWFHDRYEWHPEDLSRPSNCVHRAAVELKDSGAADYWMVGDATVPLRWFTSGPSLLERVFG